MNWLHIRPEILSGGINALKDESNSYILKASFLPRAAKAARGSMIAHVPTGGAQVVIPSTFPYPPPVEENPPINKSHHQESSPSMIRATI